MAVRFSNTKKIKQWSLIIGLGLILIITIILCLPNYAKLKEMKEATARFNQQSQLLEEEIVDYQGKMQALKEDSYIYEQIARDDLGVAKDNEIVIDIKR
jgi:cell division protein FtsB